MSDANRVEVSYVAEVTWGTTPSSAFKVLPITGGSMQHGQDTARSAVLRSDAQQSASKRVGIGPNAQYNLEFAAGQLDDLMLNAIRATAWSTDAGISLTDIAAVQTGNKFTTAAGDFTTNIVAGQWVNVQGFTASNNNGWFRVTAVVALTLTVAGSAVTDESAGPTITVKGQYAYNGVAVPAWSIQEELGDLTNKWKLLKGARVSSFGMDLPNGAIITASAGFDGKVMSQEVAASGNGTVDPANTKEVMSEVDDYEGLWIDDVIQTFDVMTSGWDLASATRPGKALGSVELTQLALNAIEVSGKMELYLLDATWGEVGNYIAATKFRLAFSLTTTAGDKYLFEFPKCLYTGEPGDTGGADTDVMAALDFSAEPGIITGTTERTIQICRVAV